MTNNSYSFLFKFEFFRSLQTKSFLILFQYTTGRLPTGDIMARHEAVQEFVEPSGEDGKRHTYIIWTALFSFWHNILRTPTHLFEFYSSFFYDQPKIRLAKSFLLLNFFFFSCKVDTPPPKKKKKNKSWKVNELCSRNIPSHPHRDKKNDPEKWNDFLRLFPRNNRSLRNFSFLFHLWKFWT